MILLKTFVDLSELSAVDLDLACFRVPVPTESGKLHLHGLQAAELFQRNAHRRSRG